jgi:hypothetical protein
VVGSFAFDGDSDLDLSCGWFGPLKHGVTNLDHRETGDE